MSTEETESENTTEEAQTAAESTPAGVLQGDRGVEAALVWIGAFVIVALAFLAALPAFRIPLHGDDVLLFGESTALHRIVSWPDAMALLPGAPLTLFGLAANWSLTDGSLGAMHGGNLLFHALCGILVFLVSRRLFPGTIPEAIAMIAGLLFVANPWSVELISQLSARPPVQALCFALLAIAAYQRATTGPTPGPAWLALAFAALAAAVASRFEMLLLPVVMIAASAASNGLGSVTRNSAVHGALAFAMLLFGGARWAALDAADPADTPFVITPPSGLIYYASAALAALVPWAVAFLHAPPLRAAAGGAAGIAVLAGSYLSYLDYDQRTDPVGWWAEMTTANPESAEAFAHYARATMRSGDVSAEEVQGVLQRLRELDPDSVWAAEQLGRVRIVLGDAEGALAVSREALRIDPMSGTAAANAAVASEQLYQTGRDRADLRRALDYFARAEELDALNEGGRARYGILLSEWGDFERALPFFADVTEENAPPQVIQRVNQMRLLAQTTQQAEATAREKLTGGNPLEGLLAQAEVNTLRGRPLSAFYMLDRVLYREPDNAEAWTLMGFVSAQLGQADEFIARFGQSVGEFARWDAVAARAAVAGAWDDALAYLEFAEREIEDAPVPEIALARHALALRQPAQAITLLDAATAKHPERSEPWLMRCDILRANGDAAGARAALEEARKLGAPEDAIAVLEEALQGIEPEKPGKPVRTIIQ